ncbi:MAG: hypothetical protein MUC90_05340 [Thermoplasmata archaeon]|nr:hypothetical protein [Thermoplasmata archaeon]
MALLTQGDVVGLLGVYGYVSLVVLLSWALRHRVSNARKLVHILTGGIVFFWWMFDTQIVMAGLAALPFVPILLLATPRSPIRALRESPLGARSSEGHPYGLVLYAISWTIVAYFLFFDLFAASVAVAAMSFGDGMGELIGRRFGRVRYMPHRTLEGSVAVFVAVVASVMVLSWFYFGYIDYSYGTQPALVALFAVAIGGFASILEAISPGSIDNLVIPLVIAGFLHMLGA